MPSSMFTAAADELAQAVVKMRKAAKLTQRQLAEALGREQNLVARIEQGQRRLDLIEWIQLCRACGADPEREIARLIRSIESLVPRRGRQRKS